MNNSILTFEEVADLISSEKTLVVAGSEDVLRKLPIGNWIGGSIPYFMGDDGGVLDEEKLFVTDLTGVIEKSNIKMYSTDTIKNLFSERYENGFTYILIPGMSDIHVKFANEVHEVFNLFDIPIYGWITGINLDDLGKISPKVINGSTLEISDNICLALHCNLPLGKIADVNIINIFSPGDGDEIIFLENGFSCKTCIINGKETSFVDYIKNNNINTKLPLVASYSGAHVNVSFQSVDEESKTVNFYAPIRKDKVYKLAKPVKNYTQDFQKNIPSDTEPVVACNCILNYLYGELENKKTGNFKGPFTFGEIAYVLVNQTLVYTTVE